MIFNVKGPAVDGKGRRCKKPWVRQKSWAIMIDLPPTSTKYPKHKAFSPSHLLIDPSRLLYLPLHNFPLIMCDTHKIFNKQIH